MRRGRSTARPAPAAERMKARRFTIRRDPVEDNLTTTARYRYHDSVRNASPQIALMARVARTEPSLTEWAVLGLLRERPATGGTSRAPSSPDGEIGQSGRSAGRSSIGRSPCSASSATSVERGSATSATGPHRLLLAPTPRGPAGAPALARHARRACPRPPLGAPDQAASCSSAAASDRVAAAPRPARAARAGARSLSRRGSARPRASTAPLPSGASRRARAARPSSRRCSTSVARPRQLRGDRLRPLGPHLARRDAVAAGGRRLRPVPDRPHRAASRRPRRTWTSFSHVWVLAHLHESVGWADDGRPVPRRPAARHVRDAARRTGRTRSRSRSARSSRSRPTGIVRRRARPARRHARARPQALRAALRHSRRAGRAGWFADRAELIFERTSDRRFRQRSIL